MATEQMGRQHRARVHAALGDPARLAIVDMLSLGDASPGEIARGLDLPTNLVAHHVNVLHGAGVLERTRSEGDRRRTYLRLRPETLAGLTPPGLAGGGMSTAPARVVFVCTHNSARSQLAAALWNRHGRVPAASAGTEPARRVHPRAVAVARRHGLRLRPAGTAHVDDVLGRDDLVVAVCDRAHESLPATRPRLHWSVPDPVPVGTDAAFEAAFSDLAVRVDRLVPVLEVPVLEVPVLEPGSRS